MFKNYLKTAGRVFRKDPGYSFLNTAGLAMGLACFALLTLWVRDEFNWDRFHRNSPAIHRLESNMIAQPAPLGPFVKTNYPEVVNSVRFYFSNPLLIKSGDKPFDESGFVLADPSVFDIFTLPFAVGNPATALVEPDSVVLTETAAKKYFGNESPIGRVLTVENRFQVRVTGIVQNPQKNSDIQFDVLGEFRILGRFLAGYETHWGNHQYPTYVQLAPGVDAKALTSKIAHIVTDHDPEVPTALTMKPLGRIHLYENGAIRYVAIFALVAVFILLIAACNFINLTTARSGRRAKEIAVRKVIGAVRPQLIKQFLSESGLFAAAAFLIAMAVVALILPSFNALTGKDFGLSDLLKPGLFFFLLATAVGVGILAGAYPAFLLSSFRPAGLLKAGAPRTGRSSGRARFRKFLVVTQFAISIILMISTLFIYKQVGFVRNFDLGIKKENIVYLPAKDPLIKSQEAFLGELTNRPGIVNATFVSSLPSSVNNTAAGMEWEGMDAGAKPAWLFVATDNRYLDTLGLTLVEGQNFADNKSVKDAPSFIINRKAAEEMKLKNPVGTRFSLWGWNGTIRGVVNDFHNRPLRENIQPLLLFIFPRVYGQILVKIRPESGNAPEIMARIKGVWEKFAPGIPFTYEFLDTAYDQNYQAEQKMGSEFKYFAVLGIFISCLGLVGLVAAVVEQKRKEIGIRKVLGASVSGILRQINGEFIGPILLSNLIAWPAAYGAMKMWLRGFAFHTNLSLNLFAAAAGVALVLALGTISAQSFKAARANPAQSLKNE